MKSIISILIGVILVISISCSNNEKKYLNELNEKQSELNNLLVQIESNYSKILNDTLSTRKRLVFVDCNKEGNLSADYICDDKEVLEKMKDFGLREIRFEKKYNCIDKKKFNEVYFQKKKLFYYPIVYFLYEYCKTTVPVKTKTINYRPIDEHWSLIIDSNYP